MSRCLQFAYEALPSPEDYEQSFVKGMEMNL